MTNSVFLISYTVSVQEVRKIYHIYIEYFFLINFVFLYSIWNVTAAALFCSVTQKRLLLVSLAGAGLFSLFLFLPVILYWRLLCGAIAALLMGTRFLFPGRKSYAKVILIECTTAVLLGGSIGLLQKWKWMEDAAFMKTTVLSLLVSYGSRRLIQKSFAARKKLIYPVSLMIDEMEISLLGLLDTGNGLIEPISKKPVCIVGKEIWEKMGEKGGKQKEFFLQRFRVIPYHCVGKEKGMLNGFEMDRLIIDTGERKIIIEKPMIGISEVPVSSSGSYQMILQPELLREGVNKNDTKNVAAW